jgi:hypothetical protein
LRKSVRVSWRRSVTRFSPVHEVMINTRMASRLAPD